MDRIKMLRQKKAELLAEAKALTAKEDAGTITEEERTRLNAITGDMSTDDLDPKSELARVNAEIKREERLMEERRTMTPGGADENADTDEERNARTPARPAARFTSLGEQLRAIVHADGQHTHRNEWDGRLVSLYQPGGLEAAAGASESVPSEGGFLIQQDFAAPMVESLYGGGEILPRVRRYGISANSNGLRIPGIDETSRANGSRWGGVRVYMADEADSVAATKPKYKMVDLRLNKMFGLAYLTDELLQDAAVLEQHFGQAFSEEMTFKLEDLIINGTGSGQPLGVLASSALVTIDKESGQADATVTTPNILNMWARMPARARKNAVWLINQDIEPQLFPLTLGTGTAVVLLYTPPGVNGNNTPYGLIMGRPVIPVEYAATLGQAGDISLIDFDQYQMIDKGGPKQAVSMHVRFLYEEQAFRITYRVDGQPLWKTAITPYKGSATQSPYITLGARAA